MLAVADTVVCHVMLMHRAAKKLVAYPHACSYNTYVTVMHPANLSLWPRNWFPCWPCRSEAHEQGPKPPAIEGKSIQRTPDWRQQSNTQRGTCCLPQSCESSAAKVNGQFLPVTRLRYKKHKMYTHSHTLCAGQCSALQEAWGCAYSW